MQLHLTIVIFSTTQKIFDSQHSKCRCVTKILISNENIISIRSLGLKMLPLIMLVMKTLINSVCVLIKTLINGITHVCLPSSLFPLMFRKFRKPLPSGLNLRDTDLFFSESRRLLSEFY